MNAVTLSRVMRKTTLHTTTPAGDPFLLELWRGDVLGVMPDRSAVVWRKGMKTRPRYGCRSVTVDCSGYAARWVE